MVVCSKAACQVCLPEALFARPTHLRWQNEKTRIHSAGVKRKRRCRLACGACSAGSQFPDCLAGGDADQKLATGCQARQVMARSCGSAGSMFANSTVCPT